LPRRRHSRAALCGGDEGFEKFVRRQGARGGVLSENESIEAAILRDDS
jgi:hypothetical protein